MSIVTLTGDNSYEIRRVLNEQINLHTTGRDQLAIERIDATLLPADAVAEVVARLDSPSLFSGHRLVIIRDLSLNPDLSDQVIEILDMPLSFTNVIIVDPHLDRRSKLYKALMNKTDLREFKVLKEPELVSWIMKTVDKRNGKITRSDATFLAERSGLNQEQVSQEINKLLVLNPTITRNWIELLVEPSIDSTIFNLTDAAFTKQKAKVLTIYNEQRRLGNQPIKIIGSISWQLHLLALVKAGGGKQSEEIADTARLKPWSVSKAKQLVRGISQQELINAVEQLLAIDDRSKTVALNTDDALKYYLLSL
jgi:DNA polymerase-3 subunit delta